MIEIQIIRRGRKCRVEVKGHAEYNPGNDIVCSAVSALVQSLEGVIMMESDKFDIESRSGYVNMEYKGFIKETKMLLMGLLRISKAYPNHVIVEYSKGFYDGVKFF